MAKDPRLERAGVSGYNQPKRTPSHPTKSHVVVAKSGDEVKLIRFGQQNVKGSPKKVESLILIEKEEKALKLDMQKIFLKEKCRPLGGVLP